MLDLRKAGLIPAEQVSGNHARTQRIPLPESTDDAQTDAIRRESLASPSDPARRASSLRLTDPKSPIPQPGSQWQDQGTLAEPLHQPNRGRSEHADGRTEEIELVDYDRRTNPIPQHAVPASRSRSGGAPERTKSGSDRPPSRRERKSWLLAGIGAAAVVAIGVGVTLFLVGSSKSGDSAPSGGSPSMISALSSAPNTPGANAAAPPVPLTPATVAGVAPLIPGYQVVQVPSRGAAFDVPKGWQIDPRSAETWGTAPTTMEIAGLVQDGKGYCPNYVRTNAFLTMSAASDPATAATDIGARLAKIGWSTSTGTTPGKAQPLTSLDGQLHGSFAETDGTFTPPYPTCAKSYSVYTFAFPGENGSFVMTIAADTGVNGAIDRATAQRILASIRPLPDK